MRRRTRPEVFHGAVTLACTLLLAMLLFFLVGRPTRWYHLLGVWFIAVNLVTFVYYAYDKASARGDRARVPEVVLHGLALFGGAAGAYAGMRLFRHKTIKPSFRLLFWVIAVMQALLILAIVYRAWRE